MARKTKEQKAWDAYAEPFAKALGITVGDVASSLKPLVGEGEDAIALLKSPEDTSDKEIIDYILQDNTDLPLAKVRKAISLLREVQEAPVVEETEGSSASMSYDILPIVPDDESFLQSLKTGGTLKIGKTEVISAVRAALAKNSGLFDVPNKLATKMEAFAMEQEEPCGEKFYAIMKMVTQRNYGEVLSVLKVDSKYVSEARKKQLLTKIDSILWPTLVGFNGQVKAWLEEWNQSMAGSGMMLNMFLANQSGVKTPGMGMQPPETSQIRDAADAVVDKINKVFAGFGIPVARALAWDANKIKNVLEDADLPSQIGATNKEQMLKTLGISVSSDYVRLECNLTRYILAVMSLDKVTAGDEELNYLMALSRLGTAIPWEELGVRTSDPVSASNRY
jgi:hypothetical protein